MERQRLAGILSWVRQYVCCDRGHQWNPINQRKSSKTTRFRKETHVHFSKKVNKVVPIQYDSTWMSSQGSETSLGNRLPVTPSEDSFYLEDIDDYVDHFVEQTIYRATAFLIHELKPRTISTIQDLKDDETD